MRNLVRHPPAILSIDSPPEGADLNGSDLIDSVLHIGGWAVARGGVEAVEVYLNDEPRLARIGMSRADVATALDDPAKLPSGWLSLVSVEDLLHGDNQLRVVLRRGRGSSFAALRRFRFSKPAPGGGVTSLELTVPTSEIDTTYLALLGREPTADESREADRVGLIATAHQLACSDEHRQLIARRAPGLFALAGTDVAANLHPVGTLSADGVAIVGLDARMELAGGSNNFLSQFLGDYAVTAEWLQAWEQVIDRGRDRASAAGVGLAQLVVPEKLSVEFDRYPTQLNVKGSRPIELLLGVRPELAYPLARLRSVPGSAYLRSESHVSPPGARVLFEVTMGQLGLEPRTTPVESREYLFAGDLGWHFDPRVVDVGIGPDQVASVEIVDENVPQMMAVGGHLGSYRVTYNSAAPYAARVLIFGDSYGKPSPPGVPGNLGDLLCRAFEHVHYCWAPFCWDQRIVDATRPDFIVQEVCERMIQAVPLLDLDFAALAATTIARKAQVGYDEVFPIELRPVADSPARLVPR